MEAAVLIGLIGAFVAWILAWGAVDDLRRRRIRDGLVGALWTLACLAVTVGACWWLVAEDLRPPAFVPPEPDPGCVAVRPVQGGWTLADTCD
jgi:hypothetical protein